MLATKATEHVARYLPRAVEDGSDEEARGHMARADALAGPIGSVGCSDPSMRGAGITRDELKECPSEVHGVIGGNIDADPLHLSDADHHGIYQRSYDRRVRSEARSGPLHSLQ